MLNKIIKEQLNPNIKIALYSNFSNAYEAIQEITDNSVSHRIIGKKLRIKLLFIPKSKKLVIEDVGGQGMNLKDLEMFFNWGESKPRSQYDIGLYSQGGKSAIGYLGSSFILITSPVNGVKAYKIEDDNLLDTTKLKEYKVVAFATETKEGYTSIEIGRLKIHLTDNFKEKLKSVLADTYRPLVENNEMDLFIDGEKIKLIPFPLDKEFVIERVEFEISSNKKIKGWIGRLSARSGIRGGIRCYYKGRLICDREFFGHPDPTYKGTLNFLFGELYVDWIPVNTNKTDFRRDSEEWLIVDEKMHTILHPHIDELLGRKIEEPTEEDVNRVKKARDLFQAILNAMKAKNEPGFAFQGEDVGQKRFESRSVEQKSKDKENISRNKYQPRTSPPTDKIGTRRRLKKFMDWDIRSMEETIRSKIEEKEDGKILVINNVFPGYIKSRSNDFYLLETAALQTVPIEDTTLTPKQYLEEFDRFFGKICEHMDVAKEMLSKKRVKNENEISK